MKARKKRGVAAKRGTTIRLDAPSNENKGAHPQQESLTCRYFDRQICYSCTQLSIPYRQQLAEKTAVTEQILASSIKKEAWLEPFPSTVEGFRNRAKLAVSGRPGRLCFGLVDERKQVQNLTRCPLYSPQMRQVINRVASFLNRLGIDGYQISARRGELKNVLLTESSNGTFLLRFVLRSEKWVDPLRQTLGYLRKQCPQLAVVSVNLLPEPVARLEGTREICLTAEDSLEFPLQIDTPTGGFELPLRLRPQCFFQTNTPVAAGLYGQAVAWAGQLPAGAKVVDLFCGVGGFGLAVAAANPDLQVSGVEISANAIACARESAAQLGLSNTVFLADEATAIMNQAQAGQADLLIVNPPRRGIGPELVDWLNRSATPTRLLYSSCNPDTLATDLAGLTEYQVEAARVFDMFPHTRHVETVCLMSRV